MSISSNNENLNLGSSSSFHEFRKQASFFLKQKIKTARLAFTDVTPAQLLVEESTNENPWAPDARSLNMISKAAFEVDDYWRIVDILHNRLGRFDGKNWRVSYKAVVVLDYLLTHGPESVAQEFQTDKRVLQQMINFHYVDEKGFDWGLNVRKKSERVLKFLNESTVLKEERARARKLSCGIQGFGSFNYRTSTSSSKHEILQESSWEKYKRSNSQFIEHRNIDGSSALQKPIINKNFNPCDGVGDEKLKENMAPKEDHPLFKKDGQNPTGEANPLLGDRENDSWVLVSAQEEEEDHHPFNDEENHTKISLI